MTRRHESTQRHGGRLVILGKRCQSSLAAYGIHVSLREHRSEPRRQTAPAVEVAEERPTFAVALGQPEQLSIECVRRFARGARFIDGVSGAIKHRAMFADEVVPGRFVSVGARRRQRQVFEV